ncbi:MAG: DUF177 domain-containing protein [Candidatus Delongbacteria bacterium]|nr:DUF177 domain-containing protein [Candidatus Delongbacteria bacterium]
MIGQELHLKIRLEGTVQIRCSRCLENYEYTLRDEMIKVYQFNAHVRDNEESGEFIAMPLGTTEIDLSEDIRDMVILSMPMKPLCLESCRGLCPTCGINLNRERCQCQKKGDDRLQALKQFITPKGG